MPPIPPREGGAVATPVMLQRLEPKPPEPLPVNRPMESLRTTAMPENTELEGTKKPWLSKTLLGILVALFWLIADPLAAMFGVDIAFLRDGFQFPEDMVPVAALFVAFYGRVVAKHKIG